MRAWKVELKESVVGDLLALGRKQARLVLQTAKERLESDPTANNRNLKTLRANPVADKQLSLFGRYRVLFTIKESTKTVTIVLVGEKRGNSLYVRNQRYTSHESSPAK